MKWSVTGKQPVYSLLSGYNLYILNIYLWKHLYPAFPLGSQQLAIISQYPFFICSLYCRWGTFTEPYCPGCDADGFQPGRNKEGYGKEAPPVYWTPYVHWGSGCRFNKCTAWKYMQSTLRKHFAEKWAQYIVKCCNCKKKHVWEMFSLGQFGGHPRAFATSTSCVRFLGPETESES